MSMFGIAMFPERVSEPVANSVKARPARRAFACLGGFLDSLLSAFNELQERLTAAWQALAFLDVVDERKCLVRQLEQHLAGTGSANALAVAGVAIVGLGVSLIHRRIRISL